MATVSDISKSHENERRSQKKAFFRKYGFILLSHHPECEEFKNHTLNFGTLRFCIGCFIGYPTAIIAIIIINLFKIQLLFNSITLLFIGSTFLSLFILSPLNLTKHKLIKIFQKFCIGLGSAFLFWWIWTLTSDMVLNLVIFIAIFGTIIVILNGYHAYGFLKTCRNCRYKTDWQNCPGFGRIYKNNKLSQF